MSEYIRRALCDLWQMGTIWEYVKSFQNHLLNITNMLENDKLFFFKEGLKPWARTELQLARAEDLDSTIAQAKGLVDF